MQNKVLLILNEEGLHARPAGVFAKTASQFKSRIEVTASGRKVNAKSSLSLMSLGLKGGSEIEILVDGEDEVAALEEIQKLVDARFSL